MKAMNSGNGIWLNMEDMKQYPSFSAAFNKLLVHFNLCNVLKVQRYEWHIEGHQYQRLINSAQAEYVEYPFTFLLDDEAVDFRMRCYAKYSADTPKVAFFLSFDELPEIIKRIRIEADIKCIKNMPFRRVMKEQTVGSKRTSEPRCRKPEALVGSQIRREPVPSKCRSVKKNLSVEEARAVILDGAYTD